MKRVPSCAIISYRVYGDCIRVESCANAPMTVSVHLPGVDQVSRCFSSPLSTARHDDGIIRYRELPNSRRIERRNGETCRLGRLLLAVRRDSVLPPVPRFHACLLMSGARNFDWRCHRHHTVDAILPFLAIIHSAVKLSELASRLLTGGPEHGALHCGERSL